MTSQIIFEKNVYDLTFFDIKGMINRFLRLKIRRNHDD